MRYDLCKLYLFVAHSVVFSVPWFVQMSEPAAPLVVFGPSGSGKSALLANWLLHYRRRFEQRPQHDGSSEEPFVFCHAVG